MMSVPVQPDQQQENRLQWWREARFGLFIHWGPVSLVGTEIGWSRGGERRGLRFTLPPGPVPVETYDNLYKEFDPQQFNATEWVQIAQDAGMRYLVFTSKHHDGFVNFDSALTDYKVTSPLSPFGRDIVGELATACHAVKLPFGCYYSPPDWRHPDYRTEQHQRYLDYFHNQVFELCRNYGELAVLWFDGLEENFTNAEVVERYRDQEVFASAQIWNSEKLFEQIRRLQPNILINNRCGMRADFDTPEQMIGAFQTERAWESCITMGDQWAWKPNDNLKSLQQCLHTLIQVAGGDGNLLFNVGPMPDGRIEPRQVERLREMGDWLRNYGESIYGTRGGPFRPGPWGASTHNERYVYLHILDWPAEKLSLRLMSSQSVVNSQNLTGDRVAIVQSDQGIVVTVPPADRHPIDTVIRLEMS
ncbi:MAG TPA: alpha-L-fucosidase [Caldilineaceae bacterium]|nr:alpha-L-fucosidase [Caldilineaceae bacterium]